MASDDVPRLPPHSAAAPVAATDGADDPTVLPQETPVRRAIGDADPYVEPELVSTFVPARAVEATRFVLAMWGCTAVAAAFVVRSRARDAPTSDDAIRIVALVGWGVAGLAAIAGWWWSDRHTSNLQRLGGRRLGRPRCVTAWLSPVAWTLLLTLTVLRLDPTEGVDVRPAVAATIFGLAMWRPYSLVRRLLKSLSRIGSDALVGMAFLFDLAAFGLLWWQLGAWPAELGRADVGSTDSSIGLLLAAAVALLANIVVWVVLVRVVDGALSHRRVARRTYHEHRQLRLVGIDPMDPKVRWAMLRIRQDELAAAREGDEPDGHDDDAAADDETLDEVGGSPAVTGATRSANLGSVRVDDDPVEVVDDDAVEVEVEVEVEVVDDAAVEVDEVDEVDDDDAAVVVDESADDADDAAQAATDILPPGTRPRRDAAARVTGRASVERDREPVEDQGDRDRLERLMQRAASEPGLAASERTGRLDRVAQRFGATDGVASVDGRIDRLGDRFSAGTAGRPDIVERLAQYGITPGDDGAARAVPPTGADDAPISRRAPSLEFTRYLMLLGLAVATACTAWLVTRSGSSAVVDGDISPEDVDRIDLARTITLSSVNASLLLVTGWAAVAARWLRRDGAADDATVTRTTLAVGAAALAALVSPALDSERTVISFAAIAVAVVAASVGIGAIRRALTDEMSTTSSLAFWSVVLLLVPFTMWAARLDRPTTPSDSLQAITFFAAVQAIALGLAVVVATVATGAIEERVRLRRAG